MNASPLGLRSAIYLDPAGIFGLDSRIPSSRAARALSTARITERDPTFKGRIGSEIEDLLQATTASIADEENDLRVLFGKVDDALAWARVMTVAGSFVLVVCLLGAMLEFRVVS